MAVLDNATQRLASASACAVGMDHVVSLKTCDPWYAFLVFTIHTRHSTGWISWRSQMFMFRSCHGHKSTHPLFTQSHVRHVARSFTNGKHIGEGLGRQRFPSIMRDWEHGRRTSAPVRLRRFAATTKYQDTVHASVDDNRSVECVSLRSHQTLTMPAPLDLHHQPDVFELTLGRSWRDTTLQMNYKFTFIVY